MTIRTSPKETGNSRGNKTQMTTDKNQTMPEISLLPDLDDLLGESSTSLHDQLVAELRPFVPLMDPTRPLLVYERQSDESNSHVHYREAQGNLPQLIEEAGQPRERIKTFADDDGKSGWLNEQYRDSYRKLKEDIELGKGGTVLVMDISRLHRDYTDRQATDMAALMGWKRVHVLTRDDGRWLWLNMADDHAKDVYKAIAKRAASERKKIRDISTTSRMQAKKSGFASGGGTCPIGWMVLPGVKKHESPDGVKKSPRYAIYEPHARVKLAVMRESLKPHIRTLPDLARHLASLGISIPPFTEDVRLVAFSRSALMRVYRSGKTPKSRVYQSKDEPYATFGDALLLNLLIEPMVLGDVRYGSGVSGKYQLEKTRRVANAMKQQCDSRILPGRLLAHASRSLALCKSEALPDFPEYDELFELWRQVVQKWSPVDLDAARQQRYRSEPPNPHRVNKIDRAASPPLHTANAWSGFVLCGEHGADDFNHPLRLGVHGEKEQWQCCQVGCSTWSGHDLRNILDAHFKRRLHILATTDESLFRDIFEQGKQALRDHERLRSEFADAEMNLKRLNDKFDRFHATFGDDAADSDKDRVLDPILAEIKRANSEVSNKRREVQYSAQNVQQADCAETETEVRAALAAAYNKYESLEVPRKRHLIGQLVKHVVILVADGVESNESLIAFTWADGQTDWLVGWREAQDSRPWTAEEIAALKELWPSGCDFSELKAALLPGRRYHKIREQALVACRGTHAKKRPKGWKQRVFEGEKTWHSRNPDLLYLRLVGFGEEETDDAGNLIDETANFGALHCQTFRQGQDPTYWPKRARTTPFEVLNGVALTFSRSSYPEART